MIYPGTFRIISTSWRASSSPAGFFPRWDITCYVPSFECFPRTVQELCKSFTKTAMPDIPQHCMQENLIIYTEVVEYRIRNPVQPVDEKRGLIRFPDLIRGVIPADRLKERMRSPDHPVDENGKFLRQGSELLGEDRAEPR